ncbi:MAG TPA: NAD-dependent epimerase/dehydratase family protein [Tepidisphaeraceae bacterium]|jgi:nucleoside-diphosphate-sugar epimerase|nr:NAD-dependent epimerase/dehydratase family protein [Tepidisphaeraceae bacterium]
MRVLIVGGTGLISRGIVKHLLARNAEVTMFNRGERENTLPPSVKAIHGDRNDPASFEGQLRDQRFDVVIDMICFTPQQAEATVRAFGGRCEQLIFCSTVCTYSPQIPNRVAIDETFEQKPITQYGKDKLVCEGIFNRAHEGRKFNVTTIRPSCTYGEGNPLIDNIEFNAVAWDRMERGLPVICSGDGLGLWVCTHRDDCGKLFAYSALNTKTYGEAYNATHDRNFTWRDFYREGAAIFGKKAQLIFMPAQWIYKHDTKRFSIVDGITQYHGAFDSSKAKKAVPEFTCGINWQTGAAVTIEDVKRRGKWRTSDGDAVYESMINKALAAGVEPIEA